MGSPEQHIDIYPLPNVIDSAYPFVAIQDLSEVARQFDPQTQPEEVADIEERLFEVSKLRAPEGSTFYAVNATLLVNKLSEMVETEMSHPGKKVGAIILDKYVSRNIASTDPFRLELSRNKDNELVGRANTTLTKEEQLGALRQWAQQGEYDELLFVDDVLAFGDTVPAIVEEADLANASIRLLVGLAASGGIWRGIEKVQEKLGIETEYLTKIYASPEVEGGSKGMSIPVSRDLTIFGGKTGRSESGEGVIYPYFLPFSTPLGSTIDTAQSLEASFGLIDFSREFADFISNKIGHEITIEDMVLRGFGIPHTSTDEHADTLRLPEPKTTVRAYLDHAATILEAAN